MKSLDVPSEDHEQMMLVQWFKRTYKGELIFSIPNGGHRSKTTAALLKATGVLAGVPDLFIPRYRVFVEMKRTKGGVLSDAQKDIIAQLEAIGYQVLIGYGAEDAKQKLLKILPND